MSFVTELACDRCRAVHPADRPVLLCPSCGGLLDAHYDYAAIRRAVRLEAIAQRRPTIWRWREFLPVANPQHQVEIGAGGSPLIACPRLAAWIGAKQAYVKYDGMQPTGSLKDRSMAVAVSRAAELGVRGAITYSSGNAAAALAAHAVRAGMRGLVLVNAWADPVKLLMLRSYGLPVVLLDWTSFGQVEALMEYAIGQGLYAFVNFQNPWRHEGNKTYAFEIWWDLGRTVPDHEIHPIGTGGGLFGAWKGYRELAEVGLSDRVPRLHGTQPAACQALVTAFRAGWKEGKPEGNPRATIAEAIANDLPLDAGRRPLRAVAESGGQLLPVSDEEMLDGILRLGQEGISAEPAGASTVWAARHLAAAGVIRPEQTVVCVVTASGLKQPEALAAAVQRPRLASAGPSTRESGADHGLPRIEATPAELDRVLAAWQI